MNRYSYICASKSGACQRGTGSTDLEIGSDAHIMTILNEIAHMFNTHKIPWDPFNISLTVRAHIEPKLKFYKPSEV